LAAASTERDKHGKFDMNKEQNKHAKSANRWKYKIICVTLNIPICWIMMGVDFTLWPITLFWSIMMILSIKTYIKSVKCDIRHSYFAPKVLLCK